MIQVGDIAKDSITGFQGVVVGRTEWLNGCARIGLQPQSLNKDGKPIEVEWFDETQCTLISSKKHQAKRETGGPRPNPPRVKDPR
jgi:hypothetical protein